MEQIQESIEMLLLRLTIDFEKARNELMIMRVAPLVEEMDLDKRKKTEAAVIKLEGEVDILREKMNTLRSILVVGRAATGPPQGPGGLPQNIMSMFMKGPNNG